MTETTISTGQPSRKQRSWRNRMIAVLAIPAAAGALLLTGTGTANATVRSGHGGYAFPVTKCANGAGKAEIEAHVVQDFDGQPVAARIWIRDSRGWHHTNWVTKTNPGWNYDGAVWFTAFFQGLTGRAAYSYLDYGWLRNGRWVTGGEYPKYYTSLYGGKYTYCPI